ncbi:unnamed protein product, partial [Rotaria sp. Silwood2]
KFRSKLNNVTYKPSFKSSFETKQIKGKALRKITNALPVNKNKQIELITHMAEDLGILDMKKKHERVQNCISMSTQNEVINFYCRDDISYQAPGRKDSITIKIDGIKQTIQKRFLLFSLREVYQLFIDEYPQHKIGRSSFQELRPPNVFYRSSMPHNICVCNYHENINLLITALNEHIQDFTSINLQSFIKLLVCDDNRESCMFSKCDKCAGFFKDNVENKIIDKTRIIKWTLWSTSATHQTLKADYNGTDLECVNILSAKIKHFYFMFL